MLGVQKNDYLRPEKLSRNHAPSTRDEQMYDPVLASADYHMK